MNFNSSFDAEKNIEYLDGTPYKHIETLEYIFNDVDKTDCINFQQKTQLTDIICNPNNGRRIICEYKYDCPGESFKNMNE